MKDTFYSSQAALMCIGLSIEYFIKLKRHTIFSGAVGLFLFIALPQDSISRHPGLSNPILDIENIEILGDSFYGFCNDADKDGICDQDDICPNDPLNACNLPEPCIPAGGNNTYEFIQKFLFNTINNSSGNNGGYGDFTNLCTSITNGKSYNIQLIPGFTGNAYNEVWRVWIDFNMDGDFEDDNETVIEANGNGPISETLIIPEDITAKGTTRMRVSMQYNTAASPCQSVSFGEVEDYFVSITLACREGQSCDDGNQCTTNDILDDECNCVGTQVGDIDKDGVCDVIDECPGIDDNLIGQPCDDGDRCTTNDLYGVNCECTGEYTDKDGDGLCIGEDPDDNDACVPNNNDCSPCEVKSTDNFDENYGFWIDGGGDCSRVQHSPNSDKWHIRLRDNSGVASSMTTNNLLLEDYNEITIDFSHISHSMEEGEDFFLEISTNGGSNYSKVKTWVSGKDFYNETRYFESISIDNFQLTNHTRLRLRCDASANGDQVYIDDVTIKVCSEQEELLIGESYEPDNIGLIKPQNEVEISVDQIKGGVQIYPNPALYYLNVKIDEEIQNVDNIAIHISDMTGKVIKQYSNEELKNMNYRIDLSSLNDGLVMMSTVLNNRVISTQKIIILKK